MLGMRKLFRMINRKYISEIRDTFRPVQTTVFVLWLAAYLFIVHLIGFERWSYTDIIAAYIVFFIPVFAYAFRKEIGQRFK